MLMAPPPDGGTEPATLPLPINEQVVMAMLTLAVVRIALPYCWAVLPLNVVVWILAMQPVLAAAEAESTACNSFN